MKISQREAQRLRKRVEQLEEVQRKQRSRFSSEWPGGTHLGFLSWDAPNDLMVGVYTAQLLDHAIVVKADGRRKMNIYAIPFKKDHP